MACLGLTSVLISVYALLHSTGWAREEYTGQYRVGLERLSKGGLLVTESAGHLQAGTPSIHTPRDQEMSSVTNKYSQSSHDVTRSRETNHQTLGLPPWLKEKFPHFMIIGFGKAGTRALYDALRLHPQLAGPLREERFFSLKYGRGITKYLSSFPTRPLGGFLIEKSPDYIITPKVPSRIIKAAKQADRNISNLIFIVITRDPINRAMSEYLEWKMQRKISRRPPLPSFDKMVLKGGILQTQQPFINASCYAHHIRNWLLVFSEEQMCYVDGDAFVTNPLQQIQNLEGCMGIEHFFTDKNFVYNKKRGFYCFQKDSESQCMAGSKGRKHPNITADVRTRLLQHFQQCNSGLTQFTRIS